ncbi:MAG: hypothetical protein Q3M30_05395 [Candidatus Electrothrix sp. Rat3]|nr:hypothetical protein [Candidatus Electrothrix rattekaaiensis]
MPCPYAGPLNPLQDGADDGGLYRSSGWPSRRDVANIAQCFNAGDDCIAPLGAMQRCPGPVLKHRAITGLSLRDAGANHPPARARHAVPLRIPLNPM